MAGLLGHRDSHLRLIELAFSDSEIIVRGNEISILGESSGMLSRLFEELVLLLRRGEIVDDTVVKRCISMVRADEKPSSVLTDEILRGAKGRTIRPKTAGQKRYIDAIRNNVITFGVGPAGTGKSVLALAAGLESVLEQRSHKRVVIFRPLYAVGGQDLGYLPGSEFEKMSPWAAAVLDGLEAITGPEVIDEVIHRELLEVLPLTHIRGRSLTDTFVIIDEAQNLERPVLLTALSRLGEGSRVVLTHDVAQRDNLRVGRHDGIITVIEALRGHPIFGHVTLTRSERSEIAAVVTELLDGPLDS